MAARPWRRWSGTTGLCWLGEINTKAKLDFEKIVRDQIRRLGYMEPKWGFSYKSPS